MSLNSSTRKALAPTSINAILNPIPATRGAAKLKPNTSSKRKADAIEDIDCDDDRLCYFTDNCDQVRRKNRTFLNAGEMKVGEFQTALGVSSNAYSRFIGQNGKDKGSGSDTYVGAFKFFKKRELKGIKVPKKKSKKEEEAAKNGLSTIHLEGEGKAAVPVYDSCDEIRKEISAYLREPGITQAGFLREIPKTYTDGRKIQSKVLNDSLRKRGASAGNKSAVFYSSYVFFEKMRLRDAKPKSKHREQMEKIHGSEGFDVESRGGGYTYCSIGKTPVEDRFGQIHTY